LLNKVREQGYCLVDGEVGENVISLAVPVFDRSGGVPLALNISSQSQAVSQDAMVREKLPIITAAAHELSSALRNL
jgi:IclR family pca regulon transcriptional regulator